MEEDFDTKANLCFVFNENKDEVLLIEKKRGLKEGIYNAPGGKIEEGETPEQSTVREMYEETRLEVGELERVGEIEFYFGDEPFMYVYVFKTTTYSGSPKETEEARPEWFKTSQLPFEEMWPDDKYWVPKMLDGEKFKARFEFDEGGDEILEHEFNNPDFN